MFTDYQLKPVKKKNERVALLHTKSVVHLTNKAANRTREAVQTQIY